MTAFGRLPPDADSRRLETGRDPVRSVVNGCLQLEGGVLKWTYGLSVQRGFPAIRVMEQHDRDAFVKCAFGLAASNL